MGFAVVGGRRRPAATDAGGWAASVAPTGPGRDGGGRLEDTHTHTQTHTRTHAHTPREALTRRPGRGACGGAPWAARATRMDPERRSGGGGWVGLRRAEGRTGERALGGGGGRASVGGQIRLVVSFDAESAPASGRPGEATKLESAGPRLGQNGSKQARSRSPSPCATERARAQYWAPRCGGPDSACGPAQACATRTVRNGGKRVRAGRWPAQTEGGSPRPGRGATDRSTASREEAAQGGP